MRFPGVFRVPFAERRVGTVWMGSPMLFSSHESASEWFQENKRRDEVSNVASV